jgi:pimeloyl-ACP methyl ester carboxylesterase
MRFLVKLSVIPWLLSFFLIGACSTLKPQPANEIQNEIQSDGNLIHYEVQGSSDQTLLFIHGWSNNLHVWDEQIKVFSENYRVVAVDLPGFGASKDNRHAWTMESFGADVAAVINHLDLDQVILVGFSMGGPVSIETAKQVPGKIRGIVLVDTIQNPDQTYSDEFIASLTAAFMDMVTQPTLEKVRPFFRTQQNDLGNRYIAMISDVPKIGWNESLQNCLTWLNDACVEAIQDLHMPIVAINSDQHPTDVDAFRKYNPYFKARIIQGVNHVVFWEAPEQFDRYLEESIQDILGE